MRFFRWNSFSVIGLILIVIGVYGLIKGPAFQFDAGLPSEPFEGFYYLIVGALMIVNGCVLPRPIAEAVPTTAGGAPVDSALAPGQAGATTVGTD